MKRFVLLLAIAAATMAAPAAHAGNICLNGGSCQPVPLVHGNLTVSAGGDFFAGGVDAGQELGRTGLLYGTAIPAYVRVDANNMQITRVNVLELKPTDVSILTSVCLLSGCSGYIGVQYFPTITKLRIWYGSGCIGNQSPLPSC